MYENNENEGSPYLGFVFWLKNDWGGRCVPVGQETPDTDVEIAYQVNEVVSDSPRSVAHMCDQGYLRLAVSEVQCEALGDTVSTRMQVLAGILIHEWT